MVPSSTVAFVVDPEFGGKLRQLIQRMPVWIVDSPTNASAMKSVHTEGGKAFDLTPIYANGASPEDWCVNHADTVDQHHNSFSQKPGYTTLEVYGVAPTARVRAALEELGFSSYSAVTGGFVATKTAP